jgi:integrase
MSNHRALTTIVESNPIELAIAGWLDAHKKSIRTHKAYERTLWQFRQELHKIGADLDADVRTIMLVAQSFASSSTKQSRASDSTQNTRLAILCSFYDYAIERYLLMPMDSAGHVMNPIKVVDRAKVEPYHNIRWLEHEQVEKRLKQIDRGTLEGKRNYILLNILFYTGRRAQEIASLRWKHVHQGEHAITLTFEHCKGDKTMRDELPDDYGKALLDWLQAYYGSVECLDPETPLWVSLTINTVLQGKPLGVRAIERLCIKHLQTHTHVTRHSFSHAMIKAGATLPELQDRLGHSSLHTTGIYAKVFTGAKNPHAKKLAAMFGIE